MYMTMYMIRIIGAGAEQNGNNFIFIKPNPQYLIILDTLI